MTTEKTPNPVTASLLQRTSEGFYLAPAAGFHSDVPSKLLGQLKEAADIARSESKPLTVRVLVAAFDLVDLAKAFQPADRFPQVSACPSGNSL